MCITDTARIEHVGAIALAGTCRTWIGRGHRDYGSVLLLLGGNMGQAKAVEVNVPALEQVAYRARLHAALTELPEGADAGGDLTYYETPPELAVAKGALFDNAAQASDAIASIYKQTKQRLSHFNDYLEAFIAGVPTIDVNVTDQLNRLRAAASAHADADFPAISG